MIQLSIDLPEHFLDEEVRCGYTVTKQMKEIWAVELDLLSQLQRVFEKYNIQYFSYAGTALGAVRHNGFIPWDDDIDLIVSRKNFEKLCKVAKKEFKYPYFFQTEESDYGCATGLAKLRNSETTMILNSHKSRNFKFNQGIFVDIFVYDNIPDDKTERELFFKQIEDLKAKALKFRNTFHCDKAELHTLKGKIKNVCENIIRISHIQNPFYKKLSSLCQKYNSVKTEYVQDVFIFPEIWKCSKAKYYADKIDVSFEFLKLPVPKDSDSYLTELFGDWRTPRQLPPDHGYGSFIDTNKTYKDYLGNIK